MSDIVERLLRTTLSAPDINGGRRQVPLNPDGPDAADEITRLTAKLAKAMEALRQIANPVEASDNFGAAGIARRTLSELEDQ